MNKSKTCISKSKGCNIMVLVLFFINLFATIGGIL